ncbi:MAG: hypothetical protein RLZZ500_826 [Bacteroidota bacterium]|jgi:oligosaccharide 4-alpha-D-glucosyltransferase
MKKTLFFLFLVNQIWAQNPNRTFVNTQSKPDGIAVNVADGTYWIKVLTDHTVETSFIPKGEVFSPQSHATLLNTHLSNYKAEETSTEIRIKTPKIQVVITKQPFQIHYTNPANQVLFSERLGYIKKDSTDVLDFNLTPDEKLYGGGARALGMNRRGNRLALYNRAHYGYETRAELMNFCMPIVLSSKQYLVHFDNPAIGHLDLDSQKNNTLQYETIAGRKTYQVIVGDSWPELIQNYTALTGRQPLPPRWAFGNFSSRFGYHSQEEVEKTIQKFETDKIPVDAIILDLYWFGKTVKGTMGNLEWDKDNFPNPEKMMSDLNAKGVKTVLITEPFILTTSSKWNEAVEQKALATLKDETPAIWDFYFGNTGIVDVFNPKGRTWFWSQYNRLIHQGAGGIWGDLGEPEVFPSKARTAGGTADEVHNIYGHQWAKLIAEGYQNDFPTQRPFILMRAGYSGSQRFGMIPWSGDVSRSWGGLQSQMEIALQMGMQGIAYMHSDLGGFAGDYFDNELYLRWLQYGVFNPIFRPHAQEDVASEVARKDIVTKAKAKKLVELRYQLLPYNYSLAYQNSTTGMPLMRPLFFEEPKNEALQTVADTYLWGTDFLIKPIVNPGVKQTEIYFPISSNWFDFYTHKKYTGGKKATIAVVEDHIPTFVRANTLIPMTDVVQNTSLYSNSNLNFIAYWDGKGNTERTVYFDNGTSPNANTQVGKHELLNVSFTADTNKIALIFSQKSADSSAISTEKKGTITLHNVRIQPKKVTQNNKAIPFQWDRKSNTLTLAYYHNQEKTNIAIAF